MISSNEHTNTIESNDVANHNNNVIIIDSDDDNASSSSTSTDQNESESLHDNTNISKANNMAICQKINTSIPETKQHLEQKPDGQKPH